MYPINPHNLIPAPRSATLAAIALGLVTLAGCAASHETATTAAPAPTPHNASQPAEKPATYAPSAEEMELAASKRSSIIGQPAPAFALPDQDDQLVRLDSLRGKWVILYFYPADDTPGCTCQATEFTDILLQIHSLNAVVYGISPDPPSSHRLFRAKYKITIPLLSDVQGSMMRQYGAITETTVGGITATRVVRSTLLIDPQGKIAWHWPEVLPTGHAARVRDRLAAIRDAAE